MDIFTMLRHDGRIHVRADRTVELFPPARVMQRSARRRRKMTLRVGPYKIDVLIKPPSKSGRAGEFDWWGNQIRLSPRTPVNARVQVLRHEYVHAWRFYMGSPSDAESDANSIATMAAMFEEEFARAGGEAVLRKLEPSRMHFRDRGALLLGAS